MNRAKLMQELIRDEGIRLESYQDTVGLWTIGVGHLLGDERRMLWITQAEADALLAADIEEAEALARKFAPSFPSEDARCRALVNMAFNLGPRLGQFKVFLAAVNGQEWLAASQAMMQSKWARQVGARAERLREMMLTGVEP